jgi:hypothetical protein
VFRLRWRLSLDVIVHTYVLAPDEQTACLTVTDALRHPDTIIALSRAEPDAVPPWRALGTADRVELYWDVDAVDTGWPDRDFIVDVVPARTQPRLYATGATRPDLIRRVPTRAPRRPQPRHRRPKNPG